MRWGVLGAGSVARRRVMPAMRGLDGHEIVALMVRDQDRADALAREHGATRAYSQVDALLGDSSVDGIYVSSPVSLHRVHVEAAARAGKHVLCEKPMALSSEDCAEMMEICRAAGITLGVCFVLRGWAIYQRIRDQIAKGELGEIVELRAHLAKWTPRENDEWRLDPAQSGGGTLVDVATHYLDLFRFLVGEIDRIAYMGSSRVFGWPVEETAHTMVSFACGTHGTLTATCAVPNGGNVLEIYGTEGSVFLGKTLRTVKGDDEKEEEVVYPDYFSGLLKDYAIAVEEGREPIASGRDGLIGMKTVEAAYRSGKSGTIESIEYQGMT